jgi:geranylgeranyl pyrophosphate synthase
MNLRKYILTSMIGLALAGVVIFVHGLKKNREMFVGTDALNSTQETSLYYIDRAKQGLNELKDSDYKRSLGYLTNYITQGID